MAVVRPTINQTTVAGLLTVVDANAVQQLADEAALVALQNQVTNILAKSASAPGSYMPPTKAGNQPYAQNTLWNTATSLTPLFLVANTGTNSTTAYSYDVWDAANLIDYAIYYNGTNLTIARIQRSTSGKPTIIATNTSISNTTATVVAVSSKILRVSFYSSSTGSIEYTYTYSGTGTSLTTANATNALTPQYPGLQFIRRGFLIGTASYVAGGGVPFLAQAGLSRRDRNATASTDFCQGNQTSLAYASPLWPADQIGGGYFLRGGSSNLVTSDTTERPAVFLEYVDEFSSQRLATLRITNTNFGGWTMLTVLSPTLAIGQYRDKTQPGVYYTVAISINIGAASPLGLYGPFVSGALGSGNFILPLLYNATTLYALDISTLSTTAAGPYTIKLRQLLFNSASTGSEVSTNAANDVTITFAAGLSLTSVPVITSASWVNDQLTLMYFGSTGAAATTGTFIETFNLTGPQPTL